MVEEAGLEQQEAGTGEVAVNDQAPAEVPQDSKTETEQLVDLGDGRKLPLEEVRKGYMMQSDYTRKTQELAQQKEDMDRLKADIDRLKYAPQNQEYVDPVQQELNGLKQTTEYLTRQLGKMEAERIIGEINSDAKYQGLFKAKAMEDSLLALHMAKGRGANLKDTADDIFKEITKLQVKEATSTEKKVVTNMQSPTRKAPTGATTMSPPKDFNPSKASWKDLDKVAAEMI
jgi:hypothetical protein